jgi:hypothetical protein
MLQVQVAIVERARGRSARAVLLPPDAASINAVHGGRESASLGSI